MLKVQFPGVVLNDVRESLVSSPGGVLLRQAARLSDVAVVRAQPELFGPVASDPTVSRLSATLAADISEFYVVEMLEKSWDGTAIHTEEGYNIGKPLLRLPRQNSPAPRPGQTRQRTKKTFLEPDPTQTPVVKRIFALR